MPPDAGGGRDALLYGADVAHVGRVAFGGDHAEYDPLARGHGEACPDPVVREGELEAIRDPHGQGELTSVRHGRRRETSLHDNKNIATRWV